ncbi:MAG: aminomethyltransferase family protein [Atopobiaceae bacterium]|nr:aminomethyltransferase family protein [Atopobiaceae bacterium]
MSISWSSVSEAPLYDEHLLLGATFGADDALLAAPIHYGHPESEATAFSEGCALCDLSGMTCILVSGSGAASFVAASCARDELAVGECGFSAVVSGDGSTTSVPLVARTGDSEYLICDVTERGLMLQPWLSFLADIEQDGFRPFAGASIRDEGDSLIPLLLWGPQATAVLGDYVDTANELPQPGRVANVRLDKIECLAINLEQAERPCYLVLTPPRMARVLWRSFLSFAAVEPVGTNCLLVQAALDLPWLASVMMPERLELPLEQLQTWNLARSNGGFVGARALGA